MITITIRSFLIALFFLLSVLNHFGQKSNYSILPLNCILHIGCRIAFLQYRRKFWWITIIFAICGEFSGANLCESPIFSPYVVIYMLLRLSWLLEPRLTINFGNFSRDFFVELPNFSRILVTSTVIIFVFIPLFWSNLVITFAHYFLPNRGINYIFTTLYILHIIISVLLLHQLTLLGPFRTT